MNFNNAEKIIELHEAIDFLITEGTDLLSEDALREIHKKVEGAELTCQFFEEKDNLDRVVYELTTLRDWLILYIKQNFNIMEIIKELRQARQERIEAMVDNIAELNPEAILLEPQSFYNKTIMGYSEDGRVVYSVNQILQGHVNQDDMTYEDAVEFFEFNTIGTFMGMDNPNKPVFMYEE